MKKNFVFLLLITFSVFLAENSIAQTDAFIIKNINGNERVVDLDNLLISTGTLEVKRVEPVEGFIFSNNPGKKKAFKPVEKVFTGVYSNRRKVRKKNSSEKGVFSGPFLPIDPDIDSVLANTNDKKEAETLAWITKEADFYHDPLLDCGSHTARLWAKDLAALAGVVPCQSCFGNTAQAPAFIKKECGGLDLATAGALLDNAAFLEWIEKHLPVKKAVILTNRKMLVYPKQEMSAQGLKELAHEAAMSYRRHTWKVIEVMVKMTESDLRNISSY